MNNKKLENKIIEKIYRIEKKSTVLTVLKYLFFISIFLSLVIFFVSSTLSILKDQQTLDLLDLFNENIDVIQKYLSEVISTLIEEMPKFYIFASIFFIIFLSLTIFFLSKSFKKIKNKIFSISKHKKLETI